MFWINQKYVPVVDHKNKPLMPTISARAKKWIINKKATFFWKAGIFCIRLNFTPITETLQKICIGVDPGSKKEAFTVKSTVHTYLNIQANAVTWVKEAVHTRKILRKNRRARKTPFRQPRWNRSSLKKNRLPPSTFARWNSKLRIIKILTKFFPITQLIIKDIKAKTKSGKKQWNQIFSPLQVGKQWFYKELSKVAQIIKIQGHETAKLRHKLSLCKIKFKLSNKFESHCVDSWVIANSVTGGHAKPDNKQIHFLIPLQFHRRRLHYLQPPKGGIRKNYGGTRSNKFKRGSLVRHPKWGLTYVGGESKKRISLHNISDGKRLTQKADPSKCKFVSFNSWRWF